jgi:chromosome segregation ATPase
MWLGTKEVSTIECSYEDLKEENIELRRERMILQSLISKNKIVNTGNNLVDMNSEIDIENKFDSLYSEFQRSQQIIKDYDLRLKDAVRSLQESRIEALQVLPLRLKIHELNAKIETLKRSLQSEVNLRIEANEEVKRKQESLVENQERLNQETSKVAILETEVNTLNQMISGMKFAFSIIPTFQISYYLQTCKRILMSLINFATTK